MLTILDHNISSVSEISQINYEKNIGSCIIQPLVKKYFSAYGYQTDCFEDNFSFCIIEPHNNIEAVNLLGNGWKYPNHFQVLEIIKKIQGKEVKRPKSVLGTAIRLYEGPDENVPCNKRKELCIIMNANDEIYLVAKPFNYDKDGIILTYHH